MHVVYVHGCRQNACIHTIKIKSKTGVVPCANTTRDANNAVFVLGVQRQGDFLDLDGWAASSMSRWENRLWKRKVIYYPRKNTPKASILVGKHVQTPIQTYVCAHTYCMCTCTYTWWFEIRAPGRILIYKFNTQEEEAGPPIFEVSLAYIVRPCLNDPTWIPIQNTKTLLTSTHC